MPPRAKLRLSAIALLLRQLEFARPEALRRIVLAAEIAAREIPSDQLLSEAWIVQRLTGVASRNADTTRTLVGQAVAMDIAAFALRLSERAQLKPSDLPGGALHLVAAAKELGVTARSLQRWRKQGLATVRVTFASGTRTAISRQAMQWCREHLLGHVAKRRRDPKRRAQLAVIAAMEASTGETLHAVAKRVAARSGASVASARRALALGERKGNLPALRRRTVVKPALRQTAWRAWRRGAGLADISQAVARSDAATLRLLRRERRDRLRALHLSMAPLSTFTRADAADTLLAPRAVRTDLPHQPWPQEARAFLLRFPAAQLGAQRGHAADAHRLVALRYLLWRAIAQIASLRGTDPGAQLDLVETHLRWAARLRLALIESALPGAFASLQAMRRAALRGLPSAAMRRAVIAAVQAACAAVDDALRSERIIERPHLASLAAALVERKVAGAAWLRPGTAGSDADVSLPAGMRERCVPWCELLPLRDDLAARARDSDQKGAPLLTLRFGWKGNAPRSAHEAAAELRVDIRHAAQIAAQAFRQLRGSGE